ncbi:MAG: SIR2 family protein [Burkholderiales bacterium]
MNYVALLGAGFSRNWGGWLANEAFEYLIGTPQAMADPGLRKLLWRYQDKGGFEDALAELQESLQPRPRPEYRMEYMDNKVPLRSQAGELQAAIKRMFEAMNAAYNSQSEIDDNMGSFLASFDAIFTLNQDMLLERLYARRLEYMTAGRKIWKGATLPGMKKMEKIGHSGGVEFWSEYLWEPAPADQFPAQPEAGLQPIYKLHGSSQWRAVGGGTPLLIIGGEKSRAIKQFEVLEWYAGRFDSWLANGTRLMVIGYGFRDRHINHALLRAEAKGLQLFIVDPTGLSGVATSPELKALAERSLIGASRRPIRETMGRDVVERAKILRFFED